MAPEFLLTDRRARKLDFFFSARDDDVSTTVVQPIPRLLSDVIERCSLMVKGDNPHVPRDALLSVGAGLPTLRMTILWPAFSLAFTIMGTVFYGL